MTVRRQSTHPKTASARLLPRSRLYYESFPFNLPYNDLLVLLKISTRRGHKDGTPTICLNGSERLVSEWPTTLNLSGGTSMGDSRCPGVARHRGLGAFRQIHPWAPA